MNKLSLFAVLLLMASSAQAQSHDTKKSAKVPSEAKVIEQASQQATPTDKDKDKDKKKSEGLHYRNVGPFRGGRSLTGVGIPGNPNIYYFGATGGGVWKSTDGALTWKSVFDKDGSPSIGSIAVANSDPNVIYVGTGEACIRGN